MKSENGVIINLIKNSIYLFNDNKIEIAQYLKLILCFSKINFSSPILYYFLKVFFFRKTNIIYLMVRLQYRPALTSPRICRRLPRRIDAGPRHQSTDNTIKKEKRENKVNTLNKEN